MALDEEIERDERVFVMGEEVAQYDGAYKVMAQMLLTHILRLPNKKADLDGRFFQKRIFIGNSRVMEKIWR